MLGSNTHATELLNRLNVRLKPVFHSLESSHRLALLLIALNLFITVPLAAILNIWFDEAYSLNTTGNGVGHAIYQAIHFEQQAPLYFGLLSLWRSVEQSVLFARLFSITCISLTIYLATLISRKLFKNLHPGWLAIAVALNPFVVWAAVEIRLFAFSILLSALLLLLFWQGYIEERSQSRWLYTLVAVLVLYTHYFLAFSLAAYGLVLLLIGKRRAFFNYCIQMAIVVACFVPLLLLSISTQVSEWQQVADWVNNAKHYWAENLRVTYGAVLLYLLPSKVGTASPAPWRLLRLLLLGILVAIAFINRRSINLSNKVPWLFLASLSTIFFLAFEAFTILGLVEGIQTYRHTISLLIPTLVSVVAVFSLIRANRTRKAALLVWISFTLALYTTSLFLTYSPQAKNGDYQRVAAYLTDHEQTNQPILVFNPEVEMALKFYYKGVNQLVALPKAIDFKRYNAEDFVLHNEQEILESLARVPGMHSTIWLVTDTGSLPGKTTFERSYEILRNFVSRSYRVASDRDFYGSNVKLLHRNGS